MCFLKVSDYYRFVVNHLDEISSKLSIDFRLPNQRSKIQNTLNLNVFPRLKAVVQMFISEGIPHLIGYDLCFAYHCVDVGV